ncbi:MAG TPA: dihydrodipicolinate synthase family protein [Terriglobales bacterium]|nr:dihydrodipicolinate synthase family protein [Terriglobales bacterium]
MAGELKLKLPRKGGSLSEYRLSGRSLARPSATKFRSRVAYAAAHVVLDPVRTYDPVTAPVLDWEATLAYRRYLWSLGFGVAEAMDTAQRGMGLTWELARELMQRSIREAQSANGLIACGAATDQLSEKKCYVQEEVLRAYLEQCEAIETAGGRIILMASRALARCARSVDDYAAVYGEILSQVRKPVILHWLGEMFDPALAGYWGGKDVHEAMDHCLKLISEYRGKVEGIKISLLDAELEIEMRRRLPAGVRMYTGDDFHYDELIVGDEQGHSDALLGIFDAIAPAAALALQALDNGDKAQCLSYLGDTLPLSRHIFEAPTFNYKTGIVFLAYLNGHQNHFRMVGGAEGARSVTHLSELFILADRAGLLFDAELACNRMRLMLATVGIT